MDITLEAIEKVMDETGADYKTAKTALQQADGNPEEAIKLLQPVDAEKESEVNKMIDKMKDKVKEGNVDRIQIKRNNEILLSIPVNVGIVGGIIGLASIPWALIAGAAAAFGLGCTYEIVKKDGTTDEL
jgi:NACalpha-BTF3-like transcription factor